MENHYILIQISLEFDPKCPVDNKSALVQVLFWHRTFVCLQNNESLSLSPMTLAFHMCLLHDYVTIYPFIRNLDQQLIESRAID